GNGQAYGVGGDEGLETAPAGRKRCRFKGRVSLPAQGEPTTLFVTAVVRQGAPRDAAFALHDVPLPLTLSGESAAAGPKGQVPAPQRVLLNGHPAGFGSLEIGVSAARGRGWTPWRWSSVSTDDQGAAGF